MQEKNGILWEFSAPVEEICNGRPMHYYMLCLLIIFIYMQIFNLYQKLSILHIFNIFGLFSR